MALGQFASPKAGSRRFLRWVCAASVASITCIMGSPCRSPSGTSDGMCANTGCQSLTINGRHACAAEPLDFKKFSQVQAQLAPRIVAVPVGASTFQLHSRPKASKIIYLDFDGHVTQNTWWNDASAPTITTTAYDSDGDPTTFSAAEQAEIVQIWQRVSECYSPYDVDVTTETPLVSDLINTGGADLKSGMRVLFGNSSPSPAPGAGGVAFLNSFGLDVGTGVDTPCFVFQVGVGTQAKPNADACIHEVGHTVGLRHDGLFPASDPAHQGYYTGQGTGKVGWAPHMGVGYYKPLVQWSKGEYANADNQEDDLAMIATYLGSRQDDFSSTTSGAKAIAGTAGASSFAVNTSGVIETTNDADIFKITCGSGTIKLDAVGGPANTMLDIQLSLLDSKGVLVAATGNPANPPTDVIASINQAVVAGTYYVKIEGVGNGNPLTTGYTKYSSLGQYTITGSFSTKGLKGAPLLTISADLFYGIKELPKPINPNIKVGDPDNTTLPGGTVKITNVVATEDVLTFVANPATMGNITGVYDAPSGTMTLTSADNSASLAQMQAALRAVSYSNTQTNPNKTPRKIDFQVNDGTITSNILTSTVTIGNFYIAVNYVPGTKTLTITDDGADNSFAITLRAGQIAVEGAGATRIGNAASSTQSVTFPYSGNVILNITCTGGNDTVSVVGLKSTATTANLGDGNDTLNLTYCNVTTLNMNGGNGTDVLKPVGTTIVTKNVTNVP